MNRFFHKIHCRCKEEFTKKRTIKKGRPPKLFVPDSDEFKTFEMKYEGKLSSITISLLNSFQNKYLYHAIDDILYLLKSDPIERDSILEILYSPVLSLQNNLSVNFFNIWIHEIYLSKISKVNRFLTFKDKNTESISYITIRLSYETKISPEKEKLLW